MTGWSLVTFATKYAEAAGTHVFRFLHPAGATGDKGPSTHWAHGENIEITVNM